jgi:hypothetical protein
MSNEMSPILEALRAARMANEASIHAIRAVEQMLVIPNTPDEPELEKEPEGCQHEDAILIETMTDKFRLCSCGEQIPVL